MICIIGYIELIAICILAIGMVALFWLNHRNYRAAQLGISRVSDLMTQTMKNQQIAIEGVKRVHEAADKADSIEGLAENVHAMVDNAVGQPPPPTIPDPPRSKK